MKIRLEIDDVEHTVDIIAGEKDKYQCLVDGRDVSVDVSLLKQNGNISVYSILSHGRSYDVIFYKNKTAGTVCVNGQNYAVKVKNQFDIIKDKEKKLHEDKKVFKIVATIPGKIIAIKVEKDARVKKGQPLVVIEAMKMENEMKSPAGGVVTDVYVKAGDKVENNAPLLDIDTRK